MGRSLQNTTHKIVHLDCQDVFTTENAESKSMTKQEKIDELNGRIETLNDLIHDHDEIVAQLSELESLKEEIRESIGAIKKSLKGFKKAEEKKKNRDEDFLGVIIDNLDAAQATEEALLEEDLIDEYLDGLELE